MSDLRDNDCFFAGVGLGVAITICFWVVIAIILAILCGGCATPMYRTPCEHRVLMEEVNKTDGAINYCSICKKPYPYIPASRHSYNDDDEIKWYDGLGWHWVGPYGRPYSYYGGSYSYQSYGYRNNHHHADCRRDRCR